MSFKVTEIITCCRDCKHYTNSSIEHDDAFTSAPYPEWEWCRLLEKNNCYDKLIRNRNEIHKDCPLNKGT